MTVQGAVNKSFLLLVVLLAGAFWPWSQYLSTGDAATVLPLIPVGIFGGLILAVIMRVSARCGALPGGSLFHAPPWKMKPPGPSCSELLERRYPGIAIQAVGLTFAVFAAMLVAYKTGLIRVTQRFRSVVIGATLGIAVFYLVAQVVTLFHGNVSALFNGSPLSIGISLFVIGFAALNLVLDFDIMESGAAGGAPKYMEWYSAFGLLVTLVWLYMEILRLLASTRRN